MGAPLQNTQNAGWFRFRVGRLECTTVWDGYIHHGYEGIYPNATPEEMARLKAEYRLPVDHIPMDLNPVIVNDGTRLFVIDAGMGRTSHMFGDKMGRMGETMAAAGIDPRDVDHVLMTHLHPDHSFGLIHPDGSPVFPKATLHVTEADWAEWTDPESLKRNDFRAPWTEGTLAAVAPYRDRLHFVVPGQDVVPGVATFSVAGHSRGQCAYIFDGGDARIVFTGDVAHHQIYDPLHPEWFFHMDYDSDPAQGAAAKTAIFSRVADEGILFHGYHFPWPGLGTMERHGKDAFFFHPIMPNPRL